MSCDPNETYHWDDFESDVELEFGEMNIDDDENDDEEDEEDGDIECDDGDQFDDDPEFDEYYLCDEE